MSSVREFRIAPAAARRRGLPPIGLSVVAPDGLDVTLDEGAGVSLLRAAEADASGKRKGEIVIEVFAANMVIDPDGALERVADSAVARWTAAPAAATVRARARFELDDGTSGLRLELQMTRDRGGRVPALPYVVVLVLAPDDAAARGGLLAIVSSAQPTWAAGESLFETLRVVTRDGGVNDNARRPLPFTR